METTSNALPNYTKGEEIMNMASHIVGGALGVVVLVLCVIKAAFTSGAVGVASCAAYGASMVILYTMSSIYHGLRSPRAKAVFRVLDHCTIYLLIAGTYTPIALVSVRSVSPAAGWAMFGLEWGLAALAVTLTAVSLRRFFVFSQICNLVGGWLALFFFPYVWRALTPAGFGWIFAGGLAYSTGAVFYAIGKRKRWRHSVFHIFVVLGSLLQFFGVFFYVL